MAKITKGELMDEAERMNINPKQSYQSIREQVDFMVCRECGDEYIRGYSDKYCSDTCEVEYINKNFK